MSSKLLLMWLTSFLANLTIFNATTANVFSDRLIVTSVSAICTENGIAANIKFNRFFDGKIYSAGYSISPDCIYYSASDTPVAEIEFVIPINKCGTRISRNTRNIVDLFENLICVQMEKEARASVDHHFLFACQLAPLPPSLPLIQTQDDKTSLAVTKEANRWSQIPIYDFSSEEAELKWSLINNWGNWPIHSTSTSTEESLAVNRSLLTTITAHYISSESNGNQSILTKIPKEMKFWRSTALFPLFSSETTPTDISATTAKDLKVKPSKSRRVNATAKRTNSLESVQVFATQSPTEESMTTDTAVYMEIRNTDEIPFGNVINHPVQIGENILLVIRRKSRNSKDDGYNLFVHSCYASDKQGSEKVMLIDRYGCAVQPKLTGQMIRMENAGQTYYYFRVSAFKFPGLDDVYFTCAVDISQNEISPERCETAQNKSRWRRF